MNIFQKITRNINMTIAKMSGVAQDENLPQGEKVVFGNMSELIRSSSAESIVLLKNDNKALPIKDEVVSVFGRCQYDYFYVGYGSGGDVHPPYRVNVIDGFKNAGIKYNEALAEKYAKWCEANPVDHGFWAHWPMYYPEMKIDETITTEAANVSDRAVVIIGRAAGEDRENKLIPGSYYLTDDEKGMLSAINAKFDKITIVMDCGNIIDMAWINDYSNIDSVLYAWQGGMESGNSLADVLSGKVNPSGHLVDTIAINYEDYPSSESFGNKDFNEYKEDIFVGYRYFETFKKDRVLFPFGHGLSYTSFEMNGDTEIGEDDFKYTINVENTGEVSGKEVVQIYVKKPGKFLPEAALSLVGFAKTKELDPKEKQELVISATKYDLASFDDGKTGFKNSYILERGTYEFYAGDSIRNVQKIGEYKVKATYSFGELDEICPVKERFDRICGDGEYEPVYASGTSIKKRIEAQMPKDSEYINEKLSFNDVKAGTLSLEKFVSSLTLDELEGLTRGEGFMGGKLGPKGNAGIFGGCIQSLRDKDVPPIVTTDGPAGIRLMTFTSLIPCGTALACTFNMELIENLTTEMGRELKEKGSDVLLAPGMNIHRDPLCGRNFEYFSEDPLISGKCAAAYVRGIQASGKSACPKHFACNNQEFNRTGNDTRISQRALREIYLKGFEICVKESSPLNIMTSYNLINGVWSHYNYDLARTVLRKEWGFDGSIMTDWWMKKSASPEYPNIRDNAYRVRAGVNVLMPGGIKRTDKKYIVDKSLLETINKPDGLKRSELERSAIEVLNMILKLGK